MKTITFTLRNSLLTALLVAAFGIGTMALPAAEAAKTYQVTGPIVELTEKAIVVQKGEDRWEIVREAGAKGDASLKVGDKVTITYRMHATKIEKSEKAPRTKKK